MITSGLRLALAPIVLIAAAGIAAALPARYERLARTIAVLACGAALVLLISDVAVVAAQGDVEAAFGTPLAGTDFLFRGDSIGLALAMIATAVALLALLDQHRSGGKSGAILLCAAGSSGAALGGNAVMLMAGVAAANVATALLMPRGERLSRGVVASFAVQQLALFGLLAAAVELAVSIGTTDLAAVPAGAVTAAIGMPWALAGAVQLAAPALAPPGRGRAWAAVGAIPCGAVLLLRLRSLAGPLPLSVIVFMAVAGAALALWGATVASRARAGPEGTGRGLLLIGAGLPVAVVGMTADAAGSAAAAGLCALELSAAAAPLWAAAAWARTERTLAAVALLVAANLPIGLGLSAAILTFGAAAALGLAGAALQVALGVSVTAGVAASLRAAVVLLARSRPAQATPVSPLAVVALAVSAAGALMPGALAAHVLPALSPAAATTAADAAALRGPQGGWSGGYFLIAAAWLTVVVVAWRILAGRAPVPSAAPAPARVVHWRPQWLGLLEPARRIRDPFRRVSELASALDQWLVGQPQLPMVLIAAALAVFFLH